MIIKLTVLKPQVSSKCFVKGGQLRKSLHRGDDFWK